jgi:UDP-N-acetylmuramoyl-tripeptide--D-alanyl-D-alanine ligase
MKTRGRRIAVLADMLELGELSDKHHIDAGDQAANLNIDHLFTFGNFSKKTVNRAKALGMQYAYHFDSKEELIKKLLITIKQNDIILIKGSRGMAMEEVTAAIVE